MIKDKFDLFCDLLDVSIRRNGMHQPVTLSHLRNLIRMVNAKYNEIEDDSNYYDVPFDPNE